MSAVLNEQTGTVHKHRTGESKFHTVCGVTHTVDAGQLRITPLERATVDRDATKCGRCFDEGRGY